MNGENPKVTALGEAGRNNGPVNQEVSSDFATPLGSTTRGRLVFTSGIAAMRLESAADCSQLYCAHFEQQIPSVRVQDGIVSVHYRRPLLFDWLAPQDQALACVGLNATIPWEIEFRDGVSKLVADLTRLNICALDLTSVSTAQLLLPAPTEVAAIYLSGSASDLTLYRPPGVALRLHIAGAASHLSLDKQQVGACSAGMRWQSEDYCNAVLRYDIAIAGSVSNMTIATQ